MSLSGTVNRPRLSDGGVSFSMASIFSVGSIRRSISVGCICACPTHSDTLRRFDEPLVDYSWVLGNGQHRELGGNEAAQRNEERSKRVMGGHTPTRDAKPLATNSASERS